MAKELKVGVKAGDGPPPGYAWNVLILDIAFGDSKKVLEDYEYDHVRMQVQELARQTSPSHPQHLSVDKIEEYYELRDKGGPLGNKNVRVFFGIDSDAKAIVILGVVKKENNGATSPAIKIRMRSRWRKYLEGRYGRS